MKKISLCLLAVLAFFSACKKANEPSPDATPVCYYNVQITHGTYSGTLTRTDFQYSPPYRTELPSKLDLNCLKYSCEITDMGTRKVGSGQFIVDAGTITFTDTTGYQAANVNEPALNGVYSYTSDGLNLYLSKSEGHNVYKYEYKLD